MDALATIIIAIILIIAHIIKSIKDGAAEAAAKQQKPDADEELVIVRPKKATVKQQRPNKQHVVEQRSWRDEPSVFDNSKTERSGKQALVKQLAAQGEGERFEADPGTLDTSQIVAPTIDPTVKPELESITGIYEQGALFGEKPVAAVTLDVAAWLAQPEGICQAVILAEILNRPGWQETTRPKI